MSGPHVAYCAVPGNRGVTGVVVIETSHIALHVWDETDPALLQLDVYTCSELDPKIIADCLHEWRPTAIEYKFLDRDSALREIDSGTM
jgi:S-adenosylmethionine/arginine decarboxylase-like enzyme|tara:strand:- start:303 stop:566 length:264 start_codon:yes stop_codon:yes gene_type:complete